MSAEPTSGIMNQGIGALYNAMNCLPSYEKVEKATTIGKRIFTGLAILGTLAAIALTVKSALLLSAGSALFVVPLIFAIGLAWVAKDIFAFRAAVQAIESGVKTSYTNLKTIANPDAKSVYQTGKGLLDAWRRNP